MWKKTEPMAADTMRDRLKWISAILIPITVVVSVLIVGGALAETSAPAPGSQAVSTAMSQQTCTPMEGEIQYGEQFGKSKVLPDLQQMADSGADVLCVEIVLQYHSAYGTAEMPGWEEHKQSHLEEAVMDVEERINKLKADVARHKDTDPKIRPPAHHKHELLDRLMAMDDPEKIDFYMERPPWYWKHTGAPSPHKVAYADSVMQKNADSVVRLLEGNGAMLLGAMPESRTSPISAIIPTSLLDELAADRRVMAVDVYGKSLHIPDDVRLGEYYKLGWLLQMEIGQGKANCTVQAMSFDKCRPLARNAAGQPILNVIIGLADVVMDYGGLDNSNDPGWEKRKAMQEEIRSILREQQQPVIDLLEQNGQTVRKQYFIINAIRADVTVDFLPVLQARDDISYIDSSNWMATGAGPVR